MSKKFLTTPTLPMLPSPPSSFISGDLYYDTTKNLLGIYTGTAWSYIVSDVADNSVTDSKIGNRTINQSYLSSTDTDTLNNLLNSLANRITAITGSTNWKNNPSTTLNELNTNVARKSNNETITGNWVFSNETQFSSGSYLGKQTINITTSPGWYRFAQSPSNGNNNLGLFEIRYSRSTTSGNLLVLIGMDYNDSNNLNINVLGSSAYQNVGITQIRILRNNTSSQMYLEFYAVAGSTTEALQVEVRQLSGYGFTLIPITNGSVPSGYTAHIATCSNAFSINEDTKTFTVTKQGYVGINTINPTKPLHVVGDAIVTGTITGNLSGNASTASKLQTAQTISLTGSVTGSTNFDGSTGVSINTSISANSIGTTQLQDNSVTDQKIAQVSWNKVISTPTTLSGYGITDAQPLNSKLISISNLSSTGFIALTSSTETASRVLQGSTGRIVITNPDGVAGNPTIDLSTTGVTSGTYTKVTTDAYGRITAGTTLSATDLPAHTHALSDITSGTINLSGNVNGSVNLSGRSSVTISTSIGSGVVQASNLATGASGLNLGISTLSFNAINWDSLTWTYGYYFVQPGGTGGSGTPPPSTENSGILQVQTSTSQNIMQIFTPVGATTGDPSIYVRVYSTATSTWGNWRKFSPGNVVTLNYLQSRMIYNVVMTTSNTWFNAVSLNLSSLGVWMVFGLITFQRTANPGERTYYARIINDNSTALVGSQAYVPSNNASGTSMFLNVITNGGNTVTLQGATNAGSSTEVILATTTFGGVPSTVLNAIKIA